MSHLKYFDYEGFGKRAREGSHVSQAVRIGDKIKVAGQGGWDRSTGNCPADLGEEIDNAFANVEHAIQEAGGKGWENVYYLRGYSVPLDEEQLGHLVRNLKKYCPNHEPVVTVVGVTGLAFPDMHVEIEVEAHLGS